MGLDDAIDVVESLNIVAGTIPLFGSTVQSSLAALSKILQIANGVVLNKERAEELAVLAAQWLQMVEFVVGSLKGMNPEKLKGLQSNLEDIFKALVNIAWFSEHYGREGWLSQALHLHHDQEKMNKLEKALGAAFERFKMMSHIRIEVALGNLDKLPPKQAAPDPSSATQPSAAAPYFHNSSRLSARPAHRRALCIGVNYTGTQDVLLASVNDARNMRNFLIEKQRFKAGDIVLLTDDVTEARARPTRQNILDAMRDLVSYARPGDSFFFHYSGHIEQVEDKDKDEKDGMDEVIWPCDYKEAGHILDDDIHRIMVGQLQDGCRLTAIFNSSHSGSALDLPYQYSAHFGWVKDMQVSRRALASRKSSADVVCFSGCKDSDKSTSMEMVEGGMVVGALTFAFIQSLKDRPEQSYLDLLRSIRKILHDKHKQKPQLSTGHSIATRSEKFVI